MTSPTLLSITAALRDAVDELSFAEPVRYVYNPLRYAWRPQAAYLTRWGEATGRALLLGMNPGPFGMAQVGVPFGEVSMVRDWMGIDELVDHPVPEHPKRPVQGFACTRSEVSGRRLWGWAQQRYGAADDFFARYFVANYCPLVFMEDSGRNRTPDKLPRGERDALYALCDEALRQTVTVLRPSVLIGIGRFAHDCLARVVGERDIPLLVAPHPSPASPVANRGWAPLMDAVADEAEPLIGVPATKA